MSNSIKILRENDLANLPSKYAGRMKAFSALPRFETASRHPMFCKLLEDVLFPYKRIKQEKRRQNSGNMDSTQSSDEAKPQVKSSVAAEWLQDLQKEKQN